MAAIVTLTTDFGWHDGYVGAVKGAILSVDPSISIVDVTHDIAAGGIRQAAFVLAQAAPFFPAGTVHCSVVDPGVGTRRRALVIRSGGQFFVGPDNGLFSLVTSRSDEMWDVTRFRVPENGSQTFHGRDFFAPIAARLAVGMAPKEVGPSIDDPVWLDWPQPEAIGGGSLAGEVVFVDRFGNLVTNLPNEALVSAGDPGDRRRAGAHGGRHGRVGWTLRVLDELVVVGRTFASVASGRLVAYPGSSGFLEVAVCDGSAAARFSGTDGRGVRETLLGLSVVLQSKPGRER